MLQYLRSTEQIHQTRQVPNFQQRLLWDLNKPKSESKEQSNNRLISWHRMSEKNELRVEVALGVNSMR